LARLPRFKTEIKGKIKKEDITEGQTETAKPGQIKKQPRGCGDGSWGGKATKRT